MATREGYSVDYWYRHATDEEQSVRPNCQMTAWAFGEADVRAEIAQLTQQGYRVQRVVMRLSCGVCAGAGRIGSRPKGTRKPIGSLPAWRLKWTDCTVCRGDGYVDSAELEVLATAG